MDLSYAPMKKRIVSWILDCIIILAYAGVLLALSLAIYYGVLGYIPTFDEAELNLVSLALILPSLAYFIITETRKRHATLGKWKMKLTVKSVRSDTVYFWQIFVRNVIKILPWQVGHMIVANGYGNNWAMSPYLAVLTVICYGLIIIYLLLIFIRKDHRGLHDLIAGTIVVQKQ